MNSGTPEDDAPWPFVDSDRHAWPSGSKKNAEFAKQLDEAKLEVRKKRTDEEISWRKAERDAAITTENSFFSAIFDVAKGGIDRARGSAEFVQKAAVAIGTIYTTVLGIAFSVAERPLPLRGVLPAIFLGLSMLCSTYFLAWLPDPETKRMKAESERGVSPRVQLANTFTRLMRRSALERRTWLRAGVGFLGAAVILLPAPFIPLGEPESVEDITWPAAEAAAPGADLELQKIVYQAQVNEAAAKDKEPIDGERDAIWWVIAGGLFLVVLLLSQFPRTRPSSAPGRRLSKYWFRERSEYEQRQVLQSLRERGVLTEAQFQEEQERVGRQDQS